MLQWNIRSLKANKQFLNKIQWIHIFQTFSNPLVICGDFDAHHSSWGCNNDDFKGRELLESFTDCQLTNLNDGSSTLFTANNTKSAIDLTFVPHLWHLVYPGVQLIIPWDQITFPF